MSVTSIGERLALARRAAGKTQSELAREVDAEVGTISRYERGHVAAPGVDVLARIAKTCGVSIDWLVTGEGDGPKTSPHAAADAAE